MRKNGSLLVIALLTLLLGGGFVFWQARYAEVAPISAREHPGAPVKLSIPRLGIAAAIQAVGLDAEGRMEVPDNYADAGWYALGPPPGAEGQAVIAAHLTTRTLEPAVFARLNELEAGDSVEIIDSRGEVIRFKVKDKKTYDYENKDALREVFGPVPGSFLNLITCDGAWVQSAKSYDERLVVRAELVL